MDYLIFLINLFFQAYIFLIVVRAILPWIPMNRFNPVVNFVNEVTEPVLLPIREGLPPNRFGMDASPFIAIFLMWLAMQMIDAILRFV